MFVVPAGMDIHTVAFPGTQVSAHSCLPLTPRVESEKLSAKVCVECGKVAPNALTYAMHAITHQPRLECDKCPFRTKVPQNLQWHDVIHKRNPDQKCIACHKVFTLTESLSALQKKKHNLCQCKYCGAFWTEKESLKSHQKDFFNRRKVASLVVKKEQ